MNVAKHQAPQSNLGVDYVVVFRFDPQDKAKAGERFEELVRRLSRVGFSTEVRNGDEHSLLVFLKVASDDHLLAEVYRSRVRDWIHGVRYSEPAKDTRGSLEQDPLSEAERLRTIYQLITNDRNEGGAGITPGKGEWKLVESVFALHDHAYNKEWIKKWSTQYLLKPEDLDEIRNRFGEKIGYYFAFTQSYFQFLTIPAAFGAFCWLVLGTFSMWYAIVAQVWSVIFVEWWAHQENDLAARWGVRQVSNIDFRRREFKAKHESTDPLTGETFRIFPARDRLQRQLLQIPFGIAAVLILGGLIVSCFAIEIFINEVYSGPGKSVLTFLPTVILCTALPFLSGILTRAATALTDFENYETEAQYERSITAKTFILNFVTSYLPLCLTAFVYVPFGAVLVPYLNVFKIAFRPLAQKESQLGVPSSSQFEINPARLRKQVIYFTVTAQIVNFGMEVVVPYLKRQGMIKAKEVKEKRAAKSGANTVKPPRADDPEEEKEFLDRVRKEADLQVYDVYDDLREMVVQFGYLAMFSVVWPLTPVSFLINNWVELRSDAVKIAVEMRRPTPWRAETIGPWLNALSFLSWMGSITMAALVYLFSNDGLGPDGHPSDIKGWGVLLSIFLSEHLYLGARWITSTAISKIASPGKDKERRDLYLKRKKLFAESMEETKRVPPVGDEAETITRDSLEEEARQSSLKSATPEERFWTRQKGWRDAAKMGKFFIEKDMADDDAAKKKKEL